MYSFDTYSDLIWILLFVFVVFVIFYVLPKRRTSKLKGIARVLGGEVTGGGMADTAIYFGGTCPKRIVLYPGVTGNSAKPRELSVEIESGPGFRMDITKKSAAKMLGLKIGIGEEVKTDGGRFEAEYLVQSLSPDKAAAFLEPPLRKEAVEYFFSNGFTRLKTDDTRFYALKAHYSNEDLDAGRLKSHLDKVEKFRG